MSDNGKRGLLVACVLVLAVMTFRGCNAYGKIGPKAYAFGTALYRICNQEEAQRLPEFSTELDQALEAGDITAKEHGWMMEIIETAQDDDWDKAKRMSRQFLEDQTEGGP